MSVEEYLCWEWWVQLENRTRLSKDLNTTQRARITDLEDPYTEIVVKTLNVN